jgi:hypothetical protein
MLAANLGHQKRLQGLEDHSVGIANATVTFLLFLSLMFKRDITFSPGFFVYLLEYILFLSYFECLSHPISFLF